MKSLKRRIEGVTLIEVAISISILAVAVTLAVPSWEQSRNKRNLTSAAEQLSAFLASVQSAAIMHNEGLTVRLVHRGRTDWCIGAVMGATACDCEITDPGDSAFCAIDGAPQLLRVEDFPVAEMSAHSADTDFTFEPVRGLMINADLGTQHSFNLVSANQGFGLQVSVLPTGRVRSCSFDNDHPVPGYPPCIAE